MNNDKLRFWHALALCPELGSQSIKLIAQSVDGNLEKVFQNPSLVKKYIKEEHYVVLKMHIGSCDPDIELKKLFGLGVSITCLDDDDYPALLKEAPDCPALLYYRGDLGILKKPVIAIVGTRTPTLYGQKITDRIISEIGQSDICVVSGLALGIDAMVHKYALDFGISCAAVLPGGVDEKSLYPKLNLGLSRKILEKGGLLVSEKPPGAEILRYSFPMRNRIIAGLSIAALVIEAPEKSGALITAKLALDYNREVLAIPGDITSGNSYGPNRLIQLGATPILSGNEIKKLLGLENFEKTQKSANANLSKEQKLILSKIDHNPSHIDKICKESKLQTSLVSQTLIELELKSLVKNLGGNQYIRI